MLASSAERVYIHLVAQKIYTLEEVMDMIRHFMAGKTQMQTAKELGVTRAYFCDILAGRRAPGPTVLKHFGLVKIDSPLTYKKAS